MFVAIDKWGPATMGRETAPEMVPDHDGVHKVFCERSRCPVRAGPFESEFRGIVVARSSGDHWGARVALRRSSDLVAERRTPCRRRGCTAGLYL